MSGGARIAAVAGGLVASMALAAAAGASTLTVPDSVPRDCAAERLVPGTPGAEHAAFTAQADSLVTANLDGPDGGDWDLALFREGERLPAAASTAFGSLERAQVFAAEGERLVAQACRRAGPEDEAAIGFRGFDLAGVPPAEPERFSLESVAISGPEDLARLEALGLDVTHDVDSDSATIATYSDAERALLAANGFEATTLIEDLLAADEADRAAEQRVGKRGAPSGLPSGRTTYRVYSDYTTDMKRLAENHPRIAGEITIGSTFEGLPIQGLEIAGTGGGPVQSRPVYLNFGVHHAREWPSGEFPMEFAIDIVARYGASKRITRLLDSTRIIIVPVVNVDGFNASRGYGPDAQDDVAGGHVAEAINDQNAYKRKNCRPTVPGSQLLPCNLRSSSGVDLNRNYGAYWGGPGSSGEVTSQAYRGTGPYSEPESEAVHQLSSAIHPTVFITNHTFTEDGKWLRQPGFDDVLLTTPDEAAMKDLGDDMGAATGWTSELGYDTLGDITGATEDWNYFAQGTYGYTPEARAVNFHPNYAGTVVEEYLGDAGHAGMGVREAYLIAGQRAAGARHHSVIRGAAPAPATLRLHKEFPTPTCVGTGPNPCLSPTRFVDDVLDTTTGVPGSGEYRWHVNPSGRPLHEGESWTMSCELPGEAPVTARIAVDRGEVVTVNWGSACQTGDRPPPPVRCRGEVATLIGTPGADRGAGRLLGTAGEDVIVALAGKDVIRGRGEDDLVCAGKGADRLRGGDGFDTLRGQAGKDLLIGGAGLDLLRGGPGRDRCRDDGEDTLKSCRRSG